MRTGRSTVFATPKMSVAELKAQGNASFAAKDYESAIKHYGDAIAAAEQAGEQDQLNLPLIHL